MLCMKHSTGFVRPDLLKKEFASLGSLQPLINWEIDIFTVLENEFFMVAIFNLFFMETKLRQFVVSIIFISFIYMQQ